MDDIKSKKSQSKLEMIRGDFGYAAQRYTMLGDEKFVLYKTLIYKTFFLYIGWFRNGSKKGQLEEFIFSCRYSSCNIGFCLAIWH